MAFGISEVKHIEVICFLDEAVSCDRQEYDEYLKTLDEGLLKLKDGVEPTRFVLAKSLSYKAQKEISNAQLEIKGGETKVLPAFMFVEIKHALVAIKNPGPGLEYKKDSDGSCSEQLIANLGAAGIVVDLFAARQNSLQKIDIKKN
jgi:hypothetical protein